MVANGPRVRQAQHVAEDAAPHRRNAELEVDGGNGGKRGRGFAGLLTRFLKAGRYWVTRLTQRNADTRYAVRTDNCTAQSLRRGVAWRGTESVPTRVTPQSSASSHPLFLNRSRVNLLWETAEKANYQ